MSNDQTTTILDKSNRNKSIHHNRSATDRIFNRANNTILDQSSIEVPNNSIEVFKNHHIRPKSVNIQIEVLKNHHLRSKDQLEYIQYHRVSNQKIGAHRKLKSNSSKPKIKTESVN